MRVRLFFSIYTKTAMRKGVHCASAVLFGMFVAFRYRRSAVFDSEAHLLFEAVDTRVQFPPSQND